MSKHRFYRNLSVATLSLFVIAGATLIFSNEVRANEYSDCIAACGGQVAGGCNNSQIQYCRNLPGAGSGDLDDPGGGEDPGTEDPGGGEPIGLVNRLSFESIEDLLDKIADILFTYSMPLLVIMIIIGAFYLLTAGGSPDKISTGKKIITWAIIGFVVILIAGSIASLIRNLLTE